MIKPREFFASACTGNASERFPKLPAELCRFRSFASQYANSKDEDAVYDILRGRLKFSDITTFNDPFEARPAYVAAFDDAGKQRDAMIRFLKPFAPKTESKTKRRQWAQKMLQGRSMWEIIERLHSTKHLNDPQSYLSALCLMHSEAIKTPLPWSHYADAHRGVCLHLSTANFPLSYAFPVEYNAEYPEIPIPRPQGADWEIMKRIILRKCPAWKYEQEYRVVRMHLSEAGRAAHLNTTWDGAVAIGPPDTAKAITLGYRMQETVRARLISWIKTETPHVEVWQASLHRRRYEVVRERIA